MTAYAWEIGAGEVGVSKEILAADEYREAIETIRERNPVMKWSCSYIRK